MHEDWKYRKVACPPPNEIGRWCLTIEGDGGSQYECSDLVVLLRVMVEKLSQGFDAHISWLLW